MFHLVMYLLAQGREKLNGLAEKKFVVGHGYRVQRSVGGER